MTSLSDEWVKQSDYDLNTQKICLMPAGIFILFICVI